MMCRHMDSIGARSWPDRSLSARRPAGKLKLAILGMGDGRWEMGDGRRPPSAVRRPPSAVRRPLSAVRYPPSAVRYPALPWGVGLLADRAAVIREVAASSPAAASLRSSSARATGPARLFPP